MQLNHWCEIGSGAHNFFQRYRPINDTKVPVLKCQKMALWAPKSKNGLQKSRETLFAKCRLWVYNAEILFLGSGTYLAPVVKLHKRSETEVFFWDTLVQCPKKTWIAWLARIGSVLCIALICNELVLWHSLCSFRMSEKVRFLWCRFDTNSQTESLWDPARAEISEDFFYAGSSYTFTQWSEQENHADKVNCLMTPRRPECTACVPCLP